MDLKEVEIAALRNEIASIKNSMSWRITLPLRKIYKRFFGERIEKQPNIEQSLQSNEDQSDPPFKSFLKAKNEWFWSEKENLKGCGDLINYDEKEVKGIIIYPSAVKLEPYQRPQYLLKALAEYGYLTIFCAPCEDKEELLVEEVARRFWVVNNEAYLINQFSKKEVILYVTWCGQLALGEMFPFKKIWYDHVDLASFFSFGTDPFYTETLTNTVKDSALLTCTSSLLNADLVEMQADLRNKIQLVNNAVSREWIGNSKATNVEEFSIVYVGAIEEWFDFEYLVEVSKGFRVKEINVFGRVGVDIPDEVKNVSKIVFQGELKSSDVPFILDRHHVGIIPFKDSELTNRVNPLKLYEYAAKGLVVIAPNLQALKEANCPSLILTDNPQEAIDNLRLTEKQLAQAYDYAAKNSWEERASQIHYCLSQLEKSFASDVLDEFDDSTIACLTVTFMGFDGNNFYNGGAERYLLDLHQVAVARNSKFLIFQLGSENWKIKFKNVTVIGLTVDTFDGVHVTPSCLFKLNEKFNQICEGRSILNIYSAFFNCIPKVLSPSIGISHGVCWDGPENNFDNFSSIAQRHANLIYSAKHLDKMVAVDTNTSNFFMCVDHNFSRKIKYVPNYVDTTEFCPIQSKNDGKIRIVYPRRLYEARGLYLVLQVVENMLVDYHNIEFHFVGKGFEEDTKRVDKIIEKHPKRVFRYHKDPDDMHETYKVADITLIPTLYSEGTSLSCLEAMASENLVISTRVGGLTDLIINGYNGFLIDPQPEELDRVLREAITSFSDLVHIRKNARNTAEVFDKKQWQHTWSKVIEDTINAQL